MPVSARLSHRLHDTLGEDAAGDLVTWMHSVDDNRAELRDLFDLQAERTDARFRELDVRLDARFAEAAARVDVRFEQMEKLLERAQGRLLKWSFGFWATALAALYAFTRPAG